MQNVFEALPYIDKIWVTENGDFHLHPNHGGRIVTRDECVNIKTEEKEVKPHNTRKQKLNDK
jgi:hypothetical protein